MRDNLGGDLVGERDNAALGPLVHGLPVIEPQRVSDALLRAPFAFKVRVSHYRQVSLKRDPESTTGDPRSRRVPKTYGLRVMEEHDKKLVLAVKESKKEAQSLGGRLRLAAAVKGWDKPRLRKELGLPRQTIQKWWDDRVKYIEPQHLFRVATILGVSPQWLQEGAKYSPVPARQLDPDQERALGVYEHMSSRMRASWLKSGEDHLAEVGSSAANPYPKEKTT